MKKEYLIVLVIGLLILGYILDALVNPLAANFATPYHFFTPQNFGLYPFTTTSIVLKAISVVLIPIIVLGALGIKHMAHSVTLLVVSALLQLYALQDVATGAQVVPLEWSLGFTLGGLMLFVPIVVLFFMGLVQKDHSSTPLADHNTP